MSRDLFRSVFTATALDKILMPVSHSISVNGCQVALLLQAERIYFVHVFFNCRDVRLRI